MKGVKCVMKAMTTPLALWRRAARPPWLCSLLPRPLSSSLLSLLSLTSSLSSRQAVPKFHGIVWIALSLSLEYLVKHPGHFLQSFLEEDA